MTGFIYKFDQVDEYGNDENWVVVYRRLRVKDYAIIDKVSKIEGLKESQQVTELAKALSSVCKEITVNGDRIADYDELPTEILGEVYANHPSFQSKGDA